MKSWAEDELMTIGREVRTTGRGGGGIYVASAWDLSVAEARQRLCCICSGLCYTMMRRFAYNVTLECNALLQPRELSSVDHFQLLWHIRSMVEAVINGGNFQHTTFGNPHCHQEHRWMCNFSHYITMRYCSFWFRFYLYLPVQSMAVEPWSKAYPQTVTS